MVLDFLESRLLPLRGPELFWHREGVQTVDVGGYAVLRVGSVEVLRFGRAVQDELLAVFRDDMRTVMRLTGREFQLRYGIPAGTRAARSPELDVAEFRAPGQAVAARLDLMGITEEGVRASLGDRLSRPYASRWEEETAELRSYRRFVLPRTRRRLEEWDKQDLAEGRRGDELRRSLGADGWLRMLGASAEEPGFVFGIGTGGRSWLMRELDGWDPRCVLRAVMLAFPEPDVILAVADAPVAPRQPPLPAPGAGQPVTMSAGEMRGAPVVVLTEGRTDAEFLAAGLRLLRPYLTDLIRFLDYDRRPEGGAGPAPRPGLSRAQPASPGNR
jgi:hypothetical protein